MRKIMLIVAFFLATTTLPAQADTEQNKAARTKIDQLSAEVCPDRRDGPPAFIALYRLECTTKFMGLANGLLYYPKASAASIEITLGLAQRLARQYRTWDK